MWGRRVSPGSPLTCRLVAVDKKRQNGSPLFPQSMAAPGRLCGRKCCGLSRNGGAAPRPSSLLDFNESFCSGSYVQRRLINGAVEFSLPLY